MEDSWVTLGVFLSLIRTGKQPFRQILFVAEILQAWSKDSFSLSEENTLFAQS